MTDTPVPGPRRVSPVFIGMITLVTLGAFEALAVSTAMPVIASALDGLGLYAPAFAITIATSVIGMVLAGRSTDRGGTGPALLGGVGFFVAGLLFAGLAPTMEVLLVGRALQGLGSGAYIVALYVIVARFYVGAARAKVLAAFSAAWVIPSLVGPVISGLIVEHAGWRWVFLSVAILAIPAVVPLLAAVRATGHGPVHPAAGVAGEGVAGDKAVPVAGPDAGTTPDVGSLDASPITSRIALLWAVCASVGVALMSLGSDRHSADGYLMIAVGALFVVVSGPRLLPAGTLRAARGLPTVIALRGLVASAFFAAEVFLPLILQHDRGWSPARSGLILTAGAVSWALGSLARSRLHWSNLKFLRTGTVLVAVGIVAVSLLVWPEVSPVLAIIGWAPAGFGLGMIYPTLALLVFDLSPVRLQGANTSSLQVADSLSSAVVLALAGVLTAWLVAGHGSLGYLGGFGLSAVLAFIAVAISPRAVRKASSLG